LIDCHLGIFLVHRSLFFLKIRNFAPDKKQKAAEKYFYGLANNPQTEFLEHTIIQPT